MDMTVVTGLQQPTAMQFAPDGRLFVTQQLGELRVIKDGLLLSTPFLTLDVATEGERGLLGVAFDPAFATNQFVYVFYTAKTPAPHNRISRFTARGDVVDPSIPEVVILDFDDLTAYNHNGGALHFGQDGKLYAAHGDNTLSGHAQSLSNLFGKVIRMNPVADPEAQVPDDNPFTTTATGKNRLIWTLGLRNPFTFSIQPGTGLTLVNDVGEWTWEEINQAAAGRNFGWPTTEGPFSGASHPELSNPLYAYSHADNDDTPGGCAITGGAFYNPLAPAFPASYVGKYFFADFCAGWIYVLDPAAETAPTPFAGELSYPVDLKVGPDGALYYLSNGSGSVGKIVSGASLPRITQQPLPQLVSLASTATFSVGVTGTPPFSYQWQRNGVDIPGAIGPSYVTPPAVLADAGTAYRCLVSNASGTMMSNTATLAVLENVLPSTRIITPTADDRYSAGTTLSFSGSATDPEDGVLPPARLSWRIDFHHDTHLHPAMPETPGLASGSYTIPSLGEVSSHVWYRVHLKATDSAGFSTSTFVDVQPNTSTMTLTSSPPGLSVLLDGQPVVTPKTVTGVVGVRRTLGVVVPQALGDRYYRFESWSTGLPAMHTIETPSTPTTYVVTYTDLPSAPQGFRVGPTF